MNEMSPAALATHRGPARPLGGSDVNEPSPYRSMDLYRFYDAEGVLLYIGISLNAASRAAQHRGDKSWWGEVARMSVEHYEVTRPEMEAIERNAIIVERPRHNVVHNTGTSCTNRTPGRSYLRCGKCGGAAKYVQVTDGDRRWAVVCAVHDENPNSIYWIDANKIDSAAAVTKWVNHLCGKRWFDVRLFEDAIHEWDRRSIRSAMASRIDQWHAPAISPTIQASVVDIMDVIVDEWPLSHVIESGLTALRSGRAS